MPFFSCMLNVYLEIACNTKKEASDLNRDGQKAYRKLNNPKPLEEGEIAFETPFQIFSSLAKPTKITELF